MYFRFICEYFCYQFGWNIIALCYLINACADFSARTTCSPSLLAIPDILTDVARNEQRDAQPAIDN